MECKEENPSEESIKKGDEPQFDWWSDEGARIFNAALDEGSAYTLTHPEPCDDFEEYIEDDLFEDLDRDLCDPHNELPPGEMKLVFDNSFIS